MVDPRQEIEIIRGQVKVSFNLTQAIQANNKQLLTSLENLIKEGLKQGFPALPVSTIPVNEHRKQHRFGPAAKIDADPQL